MSRTFSENPNGVFKPFNPRVTCDHHKVSHAPDHHAVRQ
jgi:hypothetical protein